MERSDWQLLDTPAQKAVATVSMIDCLWEKLTKVSDDVEHLQTCLAANDHQNKEFLAWHSELEEVSNRLREELEGRFQEVKESTQQQIQSLSSEFLGLKTVMEDGTSQNERDRSHFMQEMEQLKEALEVQEKREERLEERLKSSMESFDQSSAIERIHRSLREQMQDISRQEQGLTQMKQLMVDRCDEASSGLRRLELMLQGEMGKGHSLQLLTQQIDGFQQRMENWEGQQVKLTQGLQQLKASLSDTLEEDCQRKTVERLEHEKRLTSMDSKMQDLLVELESLQKLQAYQEQQQQESSSRYTQLDGAITVLQEQKEKMLEDFATDLGNFRCEVEGRLKELVEEELTQRTSLEERSNALLALGLQKLAKEVAERMDQQLEQQHAAALASESRYSGHLDTLQQRFQDREVQRDALVKVMSEQLQRMEGTCKEIPNLRARLEETRQSIEDGLAASAMNAFQGEMRLWAKMAQVGM